MPTETEIRVFGPLDRLRRAVVRYIVWDTLTTLTFGLAIWFWVSLAVDYGLFKLTGIDLVEDVPVGVRRLVPLTLAALVIVVVLRGVWRLWTRIGYPALALALERRFPDQLGDRVITAVELADVAVHARAGYSSGMLRQTLADAGDRLASVPVERVLDWRRLRRRAARSLVAALVPLLLLVGGLAVSRNRISPVHGVLTVMQWAERDLLLRDLAWPRQAFVQLVGVPTSGLRIGRDAPPPKVAAAAYEWIWADHTVPGGWRPMQGSDLRRFYTFPNGQPVADDEPADQFLSRPEFVEIREQLAQIVDNPWNARILRRLEKPTAVALVYTGLPVDNRPSATSGSARLVRQADGLYLGEVAGLKESIRFTVRAEDFRTTPTDLILIPPPQLVRLARLERRPAYRYHLPPSGETLKGLQQTMGERELSLTGDRSICTVPTGTAVELIGTADKPLASAKLTRKGGDTVSVVVDGPQFRLRMPGGDRLATTAEFELNLADADGVTATRTVVIQVTEDAPPQVELAFDVLRKSGPHYLVTAAVRAPLSKDSIVRDDVGIANLRWQFTVTRQESASVAGLALQLQALGGAVTAGTLARSPRQQGELAVPAFDRLADRLPHDTLPVIHQKLASSLANSEAIPAVREVRFAPDADALDLIDVAQVLERAAATAGRLATPLRVTDPNDVQPRYLIEAELVAIDTDADNGPKVGRPLEPLRLLVVSEPDLLAEVGRDEDAQAAKLDEAIRRVRDAEAKLGQQADRLTAATPPADLILAARVRTDDILQDIGKSRDVTQGVVNEYGRLRHEVEANRCGLQPDETGRQVSKVAMRFDAVVIRPLESILAREFMAADEGLLAIRDALVADKKPDEAAISEARSRLNVLILKLAAVRASLGETLNEKKLRDELRRLIDRQLEVSAALAGLKDRMVRSLFAPKISPVPLVEITRGQSVSIKHPIDWNVFDQGELTVNIEMPANSGLGGPNKLVVKDDRAELEYQLTAGDMTGEFTIRLVPTVGEPVAVKVVVK